MGRWGLRASDLVGLIARTTPVEEVQKRPEGLSVFIVDPRDAGDRLKVRRRRVMMNNFTNELGFDGVEVPGPYG